MALFEHNMSNVGLSLNFLASFEQARHSYTFYSFTEYKKAVKS